MTARLNYLHIKDTAKKISTPMRNVLSHRSFAELVYYERERSDRSGTQFSLVQLEVLGGNGHTEKLKLLAASRIVQSLRMIDRIGIHENNSISVLLPDTDKEGAASVAEKLKKRLAEHDDQGVRHRIGKVCTYPADPCCGDLQSTNPSLTQHPQGTSLFFKMQFPSPGKLTEAIPYELMHVLDLEESPFGTRVQLVLKRIIDLFGAVMGLIIFLPLMALIAIGIKCTSKGPVLFKQTRVGYKGKKFIFLKFRTMSVGVDDQKHKEYMRQFIKGNNEKINMGTDDKPVFKMTNDLRITSFGKFLRKTSLDELPQFLNVLAGDMSIVGPRPPIPYEMNEYNHWHKKRVIDVKPGITGLWQVSGRSSTTFDEAVRLDVQYARQWNLLIDFKIILQTFGAVLSQKGAD
jgi:lipopolysaccharide/colanic/teichoic acid biosynthesis glycosyltransferase